MRKTNDRAIAEQYIEGREIYVGVIGNSRLKTFPAWEMNFWHPASRGGENPLPAA